MSDTNPSESMDAEGLPEIEERPPGVDVELDHEGPMAPRDHPVAAGADPAYPVTEVEERTGEGVAERAARERPDTGRDELGVGGSVQGSGRRTRRHLEPGGAGLSAEEAAMRLDDDADG